MISPSDIHVHFNELIKLHGAIRCVQIGHRPEWIPL